MAVAQRVLRGGDRRRGLSLVEVMVAVGLLGVSLVGLARIYTTSVTAVVGTERRSSGLRLAAQQAEELALLVPDELPACRGQGVRPGCRNGGGDGFTAELAPVGGFSCTRWVEGIVGLAGQAENPRLRVDTEVEPHPDPDRHPDAQVVTVSACWQDGTGLVHEVQTHRLLIPEGGQ